MEIAMLFRKPGRDSGRTIIETLFFALNCVIGVVVAIPSGERFGAVGYVVGFFGGWFLVPIAVFVLLRGGVPLLFSWSKLRKLPARWRITCLRSGSGFLD